MDSYQMLTCLSRHGDGAEWVVDAQVSHPVIQGRLLDFRFYFDSLDELLWLLIEAESRGVYREARDFIFDNTESAMRKGLCDISYDDERAGL